LPSPQTEDSGTPDSVEDTNLPTNDTEASQCSFERFSSEPPLDDSVIASQCSAEHFSCAFPQDNSASVSPYCSSRDIGSDPPSEDQYLEDTEVFLMTSA
jgi:exonuclease-1